MKDFIKIEKIPINLIKPYWRNPRKIDNQAVSAVLKSIQEYGFNQPVIVDKKNVIIAGHVRWKALLELGFENVPCVILDIDENKAREYRVLDNKTHDIAKWDTGLLSIELKELDISDIELFFSDKELSSLFDQVVKFDDLDEVDINERKVEMDNVFKDRVEKSIAEDIEVICPNCGEEFYVKRGEFDV